MQFDFIYTILYFKVGHSAVAEVAVYYQCLHHGTGVVYGAIPLVRVSDMDETPQSHVHPIHNMNTLPPTIYFISSMAS